jgi:hypothetical protein
LLAYSYMDPQVIQKGQNNSIFLSSPFSFRATLHTLIFIFFDMTFKNHLRSMHENGSESENVYKFFLSFHFIKKIKNKKNKKIKIKNPTNSNNSTYIHKMFYTVINK